MEVIWGWEETRRDLSKKLIKSNEKKIRYQKKYFQETPDFPLPFPLVVTKANSTCYSSTITINYVKRRFTLYSNNSSF